METQLLTKTAGIHCSFVIATGSALGVPLFNVNMFTSSLQLMHIPSTTQNSMTNFCMLSSNLFSEVLDVRVKQGAELYTDHQLVVYSLQISKLRLNRKPHRSSAACRIKWEDLADKDVRKQCASSMSTKIRQLQEVSDDIEMEGSLF